MNDHVINLTISFFNIDELSVNLPKSLVNSKSLLDSVYDTSKHIDFFDFSKLLVLEEKKENHYDLCIFW